MKLPLLASLLLRNWKQICQGCRPRAFISRKPFFLSSWYYWKRNINHFGACMSHSINSQPPIVAADILPSYIFPHLELWLCNLLMLLAVCSPHLENTFCSCQICLKILPTFWLVTDSMNKKSSDECFDIGCSSTSTASTSSSKGSSSSSSRRSGKNCFPLSEVDGKWVAVKR